MMLTEQPAETGAESLCRQGPICLAPKRIAASHWMAHLPFAFWIVDVLRPSLLVELGTYNGASFCAFCQQIERLGISCEAYAVDLWHGDEHMGEYGEEVHSDLAAHIASHYPGFACLLRSSFDDALPQFTDGSIDLLHLDGCHTCEAITHDFDSWLPKMSDRGVILIHDTRARLPGYGGVAAWKKISVRFPSFVFNHGYGLGVALTGKSAPECLRELAALDEASLRRVTGLFQQQGKVYETLFSLEERRKSEAALARARAQDMEAAMQKQRRDLEAVLSSERTAHARECEAYKKEREELREALVLAERRADAFSASLSWKITAPLRKLARMCRT